MKPSMRVQTHQNPKVDEGPLQRECRGHVTSTLRSSGGEDISKKPADIALELQRHFACWQSLNLYIGRTRENNSLYLSAILRRTIGQLRAKSPTSALLATVSIASTWIRSTRRQILRRLRLLAAGRRGGSNLLMKDQIRLIAKPYGNTGITKAPISATGYRHLAAFLSRWAYIETLYRRKVST